MCHFTSYAGPTDYMADNDDVVFVLPVLTVSRNTEWFGKPLGATVKTDLNIRLYLINLCSCIVTRAGHPFVYKSIGRSLSNPGDGASRVLQTYLNWGVLLVAGGRLAS